MSDEFTLSDTGDFFVSTSVQNTFNENGYVIVRGLITKDEITKVKDCIEQSEDIKANAFGRADANGRTSRLCVWNRAGNDVSGILARIQKVAGTMQQLLGGDEIYHYHSKLMMKEARTGGAFVWHQDYGYWYNNGCMLPEMGSIFIPIDKCVKENGCLQVLKGSHKMGRIGHALTGDQAGADLERVEMAKTLFELVHVELDPGDVLFFHCNLLHTSSQNNSDLRRYVIITSVNKRKNNPLQEHHHPQYHPLKMLPNSALLECDLFTSTEDKGFMDPTEDASHKIKNLKS